MPYRHLDEVNIIRTTERLKLRISERFPNSGLSKVADELITIGNEIVGTLEYLKRPNFAIRVPVAIAILLMVGLAVAVIITVQIPSEIGGLNELVQLVDAGINDIVFLGIAIYFLLNVESRLKRKRALRMIHSLRSLAHVVDMHQLTKDPERISSTVPDTASSPQRTMTPVELGRYLDYCSELLSCTSKFAALLVEQFNDEVILGAVNEIETLTTGLQGKIWQKIRLIDR